MLLQQTPPLDLPSPAMEVLGLTTTGSSSSITRSCTIYHSCRNHRSPRILHNTNVKLPILRNTTRVLPVVPLLSTAFASACAYLLPVPTSIAAPYGNMVIDIALSSPVRPIEINESSYAAAIQDNPVVLLVGLVALSLPFILPRILKIGDPEPFGSVTAKEAFEELSAQGSSAQLVDIRTKEEVGTDGAPPGVPDLGAFNKKVLQLPYEGQEDYAERVLVEFMDVESTTLFIMDRLDGKSFAVAKILSQQGYRGAYAIIGGADGYGGWQLSDLPWQLTSGANSLDEMSVAESGDTSSTETKDSEEATSSGAHSGQSPSLEDDKTATVAAQSVQSNVEDAQEPHKSASSSRDLPPSPTPLSPYTRYPGLEPPSSRVPSSATMKREEASNAEYATSTPESAHSGQALSAEAENRNPVAAQAPQSTLLLSRDLPPSPTPLSPYTQYPSMKPPSPPTPPSPPALTKNIKGAANALAAQSGQLPSAEAEKIVAGAPENVGETHARQSSASSSRDLPPSQTPLSPYTQYPGLRSPSSPIPSSPSTSTKRLSEATHAEQTPGTPRGSHTISVVAQASRASSSRDLPPSPTPLSPYARYPHLRPPSSLTPSRP